jgi:hypothetical protein
MSFRSTTARSLRCPFVLTFVLTATLSASQALAGLTFTTTKGAGFTALEGSNPALAASIYGGFQQAQAIWSGYLADSINVNLVLDWAQLDGGTLASTNSNEQPFPLVNTLAALSADRHSADDFTAFSNLPSGPALSGYVIDRAGTRYLNTDSATANTVLSFPTANAKALGLWAANDPTSDGTVTFNSSVNFGFDHSSVAPGTYDFLGIAEHEIGHALGFVSGVDGVDFVSKNGPGVGLDLNGPLAGLGTGDNLPVFSVIDMYRHSTEANAISSTTLELAPGGAAFFSIDGGVTNLALFSNGVYNGDGRQDSHWKANTPAVMKPAISSGTVQDISALDLRAFDVIGYQLVPEPSTFVLAFVAGIGLAVTGYRRRRA